MKNTKQNNNQRSPQNSNSGKTGLGEVPGKSQETTKVNKEDAGGTGLGHRKDQGKDERKKH